MGSRWTLWTLLALAAAPFLLEATTGCDLVFTLDPADPNAVSCDCRCDAGGQPLDILVAKGEDDVEEVGGSMDLGNGDLDLGVGYVGLRFENLTIPQGAIIDHAYVQFTGDQNGETDATSFKILIEDSTAAANFTNADNDLSGRSFRPLEIPWSPGPWDNDDAGADQRTPDLAALLQDLVSNVSWNDSSAIVLRFEGTSGHRSAESFEGSDQQPLLIVEVDADVAAILPICASEDLQADGFDEADATTQCLRTAATLSSIAGACGYPQPCTCTVVDARAPGDEDAPDIFPAATCAEFCPSELVDAPSCDNFDPNAYTACRQAGGGKEECQDHVSATAATLADAPICVSSGSPLASHAFGERSQCRVSGVSDITVDGKAPKENPATAGRIEILGEPCPGGGCLVEPYFDLHMDDIEFEVRWHSDPKFKDLVADGTGLESAVTDANGDALFLADTILGTGAGRRSGKTDGSQIDAMNPDPVRLRADYAARTCQMDGSLVVAVGDDGVCENDDTIPCASDDDCTSVGGACDLPEDMADMEIALDLEGDIVNQPPSANAGADQEVECTSSAGASFLLDGRGSVDPDHNLALASWREGTRTGPLLGNGLLVEQALGIGEAESYVLRLVDGFAQTDEATTQVAVVDTTPPEIECNAPPTVKPPDAEQGLDFAASASDVCDADVEAVVTGFDCFKFTKKDRFVSKLESCVVSFAGDTLSIHDVGGYGDTIQWTVEATDDAGNVGHKTCEVTVMK